MSFTLIHLDDAAKRAGISESSLRRLVKSRRGPRLTRIGGRVFINEAHLSEWVESCAAPRAA